MNSIRKKFVCQNCGYESIQWLGKCPSCGQWNSFAEEFEKKQKSKNSRQKSETTLVNISTINEKTINKAFKLKTNIKEFDRVLGGGLISGSVVLIAGDPGIGKSTLVLQAVSNLKEKVIYVTGEESLEQISLRAARLKLKNENLFILAETNLNQIIEILEQEKPSIAVIDSIQTIYRDELESSPGTIGQIRECTSVLMDFAKKNNVAIIIIGHITKDGLIAGPKALEHIVDTVIQFSGEKNYSFRILRAIKNRFGSTNEIGIFEMHEDGLKEVENPSQVFLAEREYGASGSVVTSIIEGTRPILVEVQALVTPSGYGMAQRVTTGFDSRRLSILLAVIEKRLNFKLSQQNVFLNIAGGVEIDEPAADLAVCCAIISSIKDIPADSLTCVVGEVGLGGEIRSISNLEKRIQESQKLGFKKIITPNQKINFNLNELKINVTQVKTLKEAVKELLE
ncbi:MAG: DNA repair protein RadA [Ignavibacteria bacterium]|jgi:DNA repair protein RadA/Sms|nr:DNA repair protein RadA [Ignavibacteria bacterium]MDH7526799.1 DNA repair protein RadA [Ignavibacteria bacterium]